MTTGADETWVGPAVGGVAGAHANAAARRLTATLAGGVYSQPRSNDVAVDARPAPGRESIAIRALQPSDRDLLTLIHERLGPQSRVQRYLAPKPALSQRDLAVFTAVDGCDHVGLIAFAGSMGSPVGVARYVRPDNFEVAETAIEVIDEWQRRGVGRLLMAQLRERALRAGVRRFTWFALASNCTVAALARDLSDRRCSYVGDGVVQWSGAIARTHEGAGHSPAAQLLNSSTRRTGPDEWK